MQKGEKIQNNSKTVYCTHINQSKAHQNYGYVRRGLGSWTLEEPDQQQVFKRSSNVLEAFGIFGIYMGER